MRRHNAMASFVVVAALAAGCAHSGSAHSRSTNSVAARGSGQEAPDAVNAARSFDAGVAAFARRDYAASLAAFDRAYRLAPNTDVLFNLARTHDALGHDVEAARYYVAYMRSATDIPQSITRECQDALFRIQSLVGWVMVRGRTRVTVDGTALAFMPRGTPIAVSAGVHTIRAEDDRTSVAVRSRAGEVLALSFATRDAVVLLETQPLSELNVGTNAVLSTALYGR